MTRFGMGYDVHKLVEGRKLILGGVEVPHTLGLLGHSDADVLLHAISDALLGAAALGDIGRHFPDTDPKYAGADSMKLLAHVVELIKEKGYVVGNVDATIVAQRPKLKDYIARMNENIARVLEVDVGTLLSTAAESDETPNIIIVDDNKAVIADSLLVLEVELGQVNVKATTEEKLGFTGTEQGISAYAVAGLERS